MSTQKEWIDTNSPTHGFVGGLERIYNLHANFFLPDTVSVLSSRPSPHILASLAHPPATRKRRSTPATSTSHGDLLEIDDEELARQLTIYESELFMSITEAECRARTGSVASKDIADGVTKIVKTSNKVRTGTSDILCNDWRLLASVVDL